MKKKLFQNYNFEFTSNEKKLLKNFCSQAIKQMGGSDKFYNEERAFNSIIEKLNTAHEEVKFTKDEKIRLTNHLKQNIDHLNKELKNSWFIKKWLMNSLLKQYNSLFENHFKG